MDDSYTKRNSVYKTEGKSDFASRSALPWIQRRRHKATVTLKPKVSI